jgi:hypothetical protein
VTRRFLSSGSIGQGLSSASHKVLVHPEVQEAMEVEFTAWANAGSFAQCREMGRFSKNAAIGEYWEAGQFQKPCKCSMIRIGQGLLGALAWVASFIVLRDLFESENVQTVPP